MNGFDLWDFALLGIASLIAVRSLIGLMQARRDKLIAEVQQQINAQNATKRKANKKGEAA